MAMLVVSPFHAQQYYGDCVLPPDMDFTELSDEPLVFTPATSRACLNISIEDDNLLEENEIFIVSIVSMATDTVSVHPNSSMTVTIQEDDSKLPLTCE